MSPRSGGRRWGGGGPRRTQRAGGPPGRTRPRRPVPLRGGLEARARGDPAPPLGPLDLAEAVDSALAAARDRHPEVQWAADVPDEVKRVDAWEPGLRSLLDNLLENGARHGQEEGQVRVTLRGGAAPELIVEDDG